MRVPNLLTYDFKHDAKEGLSHLEIFNMKEDQGQSHIQKVEALEENQEELPEDQPPFLSKSFSSPFLFFSFQLGGNMKSYKRDHRRKLKKRLRIHNTLKQTPTSTSTGRNEEEDSPLSFYLSSHFLSYLFFYLVIFPQ